MPMRLPTLYLGHGAPTLSIEDNAATRFFSEWPRHLPRPAAIVVISAHWETGEELRVTAWERKPIIHDFQGFPTALSRLDYPAPGSVALAERIRGLLDGAGYEGVSLDDSRGLDHGSWVPLRFMYPDADIPVLQLSLPTAWDPARLYDLGRALAPLREEGLLLIGSGGAVHNLRDLVWEGDHAVKAWARIFEDWLRENLKAWNTADLFNYWRMAPHGVQAHPSEEHLLPLFVAMGAGDAERHPEFVHEGFMYGSLSMLAVEFA